jgi:hypothetical protein
MTEEEMKQYNALFKEFQSFLNRPLTEKEKRFIKWMVNRSIEMEYYKSSHV